MTTNTVHEVPIVATAEEAVERITVCRTVSTKPLVTTVSESGMDFLGTYRKTLWGAAGNFYFFLFFVQYF